MADGSGIPFASLIAKVDATSVDAFADKGARMVAVGGQMEAATERLDMASRKAGGGMRDMAEAVNSTTSADLAQVRALNQQVSAMKAAETAAEQLAQRQRFLAQAQADFAQANALSMRGMTALGDAHAKVAAGAKLSAAETVNFGRQLADIGVTGAMGMNPLMIAIQQLPQLADIFATAGARGVTFNTALKGMFGTIPVVGIALGGLALAAIGVGVAMNQGSKDAADFNNMMVATGGYAGVTGVQFEQMAAKISRATDSSLGNARGALLELARSGSVSGEALRLLAEDSVRLGEYTGKSGAEMASTFAKMGDDVTGFAVEFQSSYHLLTAAQIEHISMLQETGRVTEAQLAFALALHQRLGTEAPEQLGYLEAAWRGVGNAISDAWSYLKGFGNESIGASRKLESINGRIADIESGKVGNNPFTGKRTGDYDNILERLKQERLGLQFNMQLQAAKAKQTSQDAQAEQAATRATQEHARSYADMGDNVAKAQREIQRYRDGQTAIRKVSPDSAALDGPARAKQIEADILKKYTPEATKAERAGASLARQEARRAEALARTAEASQATVDATLELAKAYGEGDAAALRAQARVEALAKAIKDRGDRDAYVARQLDLNAAKAAATAAKTVADLNAETTLRKGLNDQVAAGALTQDEAAQQLTTELQLRGLRAQMMVADKDTQEVLLGLIQQVTQARADANTQAQRAGLIAGNRQKADELTMLAREAELIGVGNAERAVELAQLAERLRLGAKLAETPEGKESIRKVGEVAGAGANLQTSQDNYNASLTESLDLLTQLEAHASSAADGLANGFGRAGEAVGNLTVALITNARTMEQLAVQREADRKAAQVGAGASDAQRALSARRLAAIESNYARETAQVRLEGYATATRAAMGFVKEGSTGYKVLQTAEMAFHTIQMLNSIQAMAMKGTEVATHVAAEGVKASASGITAYAVTLASLPFPFNLAAGATVLAALASVGVAIAGGGGGKGAGVNVAQQRQEQQGTGSVLGDGAAKSESIARAMALATQNSNRELEYTSQMVRSLRSIEANMDSLSAAVARSVGIGGSLDTSGIGGTTSSGPSTLAKLVNPFAAVFPGLFGTKTKTTLTDVGLDLGTQNLGDIVNGGLSGSSYQDIATQTKKKAFGLTYSNKTKTSTNTADLDAELSGEITRVIGSLRDGVLAAAGVLGIQGAEATLDALNLNLGKISLKDLKGDELTAALNAVFGKAGDDMARGILGDVAQFQKAGEGAFETLVRVARGYQVVDVALSSIGRTFGAVGVSSLQAREDLLTLVGGMDELASLTSSFAENFLTDAERLAPVQAAVSKEMARLGLSGIQTKEQFKQLLLGLDLTTQEGRNLYASLLEVAPAFAKVKDAAAEFLNTAQEALDAALDRRAEAGRTLIDVYEREAGVFRETASRFGQLAASLRAFGQQLVSGPLAQLSPQDAYNAAKARFNDVRTRAASGDEGALKDLQGVSEDYLEASKAYYASSREYFADLAEVRAAVQTSVSQADQQVVLAEQQLAQLTLMVSGVIDLNTKMASLGEALAAYAKAVADAVAAQAKVTQVETDLKAGTNTSGQFPGNTPTPTNDNPAPAPATATPTPTPAQPSGPTTVNGDGAAYVQANPDLAAYYAANKDALDMSEDEYGRLQWNRFGKTEDRPVRLFGNGGAFSGGVVSAPTEFSTPDGQRNAAGERGGFGEGIMPLANIGGRLGVAASYDPEVRRLLGALLKEAQADKVQREAASNSNDAELKSLRESVRKLTQATRAGGAQ